MIHVYKTKTGRPAVLLRSDTMSQGHEFYLDGLMAALREMETNAMMGATTPVDRLVAGILRDCGLADWLSDGNPTCAEKDLDNVTRL